MPKPPLRPTARMRRGAYGQRLARALLEKLGFQIVEENFRSRWGELDIVAIEEDALVFVEVRTRTGDATGTPEESVTPAKARRLALLSDIYRNERSDGPALPPNSRIDLVAIDLDAGGAPPQVRIVRNAVEAPDGA